VIDAVVLDVEGTTSPAASVTGPLYDYFRRHVDRWLDGTGPDVIDVLDDVRRLLDNPDADRYRVAEFLHLLLDSDVKSEVLKRAQGAVCHTGFTCGELQGRFFPDVPPAVRAWHHAGRAVHVYSSGSEHNQRDWFAHAEDGNLSPWITGYFDLDSAGGKTDPQSYSTIRSVIGVPSERTLFLTDSTAELAAATAAGWTVAGVARPGEQARPVGAWPWIAAKGGSLASGQ